MNTPVVLTVIGSFLLRPILMHRRSICSHLIDANSKWLFTGVAGGDGEGFDEGGPGVGGIEDSIDPETGGGVADVGLALVVGSDLSAEVFELGSVGLLALFFEAGDHDVEQRVCRLRGAHDGTAGGGPGEDEAGVKGF